MSTLTVKIPSELEQALNLVAERAHMSRSEVVRQAIWNFVSKQDAPAKGLLDKMPDLVGCFSGGPSDLSSNPAHLADFGRI